MAARSISVAQVRNTLTTGARYADPKHGSTVYYRSPVSVATNNGWITTAYKGRPSGRMIALP